uniref:Achalasia, adrenocortical insufficiency, alacrimia n=1 Tax=Gadus morhua TaxID=8049 RepID=A0A8C5CSM0_GADMO
MCSLAFFPPPLSPGKITLCETNNELVSTESCQKQDYGPLSLYFPRESLKPHSRTENSSKAAFLQHSETLWIRSATVDFYFVLWGFPAPKWLSVSSGCVLALLQRVSSLHGALFPHLKVTSDCAVRAFAWHPHTEKFAVALLDDSIKIYNPKSATPPTLKHRLQRSVASVQWKPLCASALAVACQTCLLVWHVDPCSLSIRPSSGCAQVLSHPGHSPVTSIAWSPSGSLLVSASPVDTSMMVWDVAAESSVPLQRVGGGGVSFLSWSPDGSHVLAATPAPLFRVWETRMWTCERWPSLKGRCESGCWSPDGSRLLFTIQGEAVIYSLTFSDTTGTMKGSKAAAVVADLSETTFTTPAGDIIVGGEVQLLAWDPRGERLAVLLKGDSEAAARPAMIAVFKTRNDPIFELLPCGFIQGEPGAEPRLMQFSPNFPHGAMLTVCWSNGRITHVPFYFLSAGVPHLGLNGSPAMPQPEERLVDHGNSTLFTELCS